VRLVCDASAVVALLIDNGPEGQWAAEQVDGAALSAPHLILFEAANLIRRHELAGLVSSDQARQAHADLVDLPIDCWPYELLAARVWELRRSLTGHDASYAALAELLDCPLVTLDRRIRRVRTVRCEVRTPRARR